MTFILTVIKLLIVLGIVATIHEIGHFIFAKLFKMTVNEFSIGFGKKIIQRKHKGTMYSLRWIPFGGYVAIEGEGTESDDVNCFSNKPAWQRIIVLFMGATFNALLAAIIFLSVNFGGPTYISQIKGLDSETVAYEAGLRDGDVITKIGNKKINIYQDILLFNELKNADVKVKYERDGKAYETVVKDAVKDIGYAGIYFDTNIKNDSGDTLTNVQMTEPGKPASNSGMKTGDIIVSVNDTLVYTSKEVVNIVSTNAKKELTFVVNRNGKNVTIKLKPEAKRNFDLGITDYELVKTNIKYSYYKSVTTISQIVGSYVDLFKGNVSVNQLSGIVGIGEVISKADGMLEFLNLLGIISLAIGVANIMPFPPLDGGKIVLVLIEGITRKKVPLKVELVLSYIGFGLLIALTIFVTINDIRRIV